ncbi:MAG: response regulator transcription factor [bacterium]|nr:response regulator transcription factor [bacterium]
MNNILIIEDDPAISSLLVRTLELANFNPSRTNTLSEAYSLINEEIFNLIILELGLPDGNGLDLLLNKRNKDIPVIILTARNLLNNKIDGLSLGADDYITKPFEPFELIARIKAVLRRYNQIEHNEFKFDDVVIKVDQRIVFLGDSVVNLTPKEFDLLHYLTENGGYAVRRDKIIEKVWGYESECTTRTVDIHVQRLRKKLSTDRIETVYKVGYRFNKL